MTARFELTMQGVVMESNDALQWAVVASAPDARVDAMRRRVEAFARMAQLDLRGAYLPDPPAAIAEGLRKVGVPVVQSPDYTPPSPPDGEVVY